jgi:hypothetical protein
MATMFVAISAYASRFSNLVQLSTLFISCIALIGLSLWVALSKRFDRLTLRAVLLTTVWLCFIGFFSFPILEDDHFRFLWDGYVTATTGRPYQHAPSFYFGSNDLAQYLQTILNGINNPSVPTVYGPLLQIVFALAHLIAPGELWPLQVVLMCALLSVVVLLAKAGVHPKWLLIFVIHPLIVKESILTVHPDLLIGALVLWATLLWRTEYFKSAIVVVAAASAIKISIAVILLFFCFDRRGKFSVSNLLVSTFAIITLHLPMLVERLVGSATGVADFGNQWVFNPTLFRGIAAALGDPSARVFVVAAFALALTGLLYAQRKVNDIVPSIVCTFAILFLLSPVVNPWYWLWILPLAFVGPGGLKEASQEDLSGTQTAQTKAALALWLAPAVSLLAYSHVGTVQSNNHLFVVPYWAGVLQLVTTLWLLLSNSAFYRRRVVSDNANS